MAVGGEAGKTHEVHPDVCPRGQKLPRTEDPRAAAWRGGPRSAPTPARPGPCALPHQLGLGHTHSMIRETCSRTGTLLSLKAVVMKQPKVSAAITLNEKANSEFARDNTVFIAAVTLEPYSTRKPRAPFRPRTRSLRSAPPALRAFRGARAAAAPPPFRSSDAGERARTRLPDTPTRRRERAERRSRSRSRARLSFHHQSATSRGAAEFRRGRLVSSVLASPP